MVEDNDDRASSALADLQAWYRAQCDGNWEEDCGVTILSLDNPGWSVTIDLDGTRLEDRAFVSVEEETSQADWIHCHVKDKRFFAACGPSNLARAIAIFIDWAKSTGDWLGRPQIAPAALFDQNADQVNWDALNQEAQQEQCQHEDCKRRRIQYSVFCRSHHYVQLHKKAPPPSVFQIWVYGSDTGVQEARAKILASVRETFGDEAVNPHSVNGTTILGIEWLKTRVELELIDEKGLFKLVPTKWEQRGQRDNTEFLMRLFFCDIVEPARDTTGSVAASVNIWTPSD
jgi:hypothetical protein